MRGEEEPEVLHESSTVGRVPRAVVLFEEVEVADPHIGAKETSLLLPICLSLIRMRASCSQDTGSTPHVPCAGRVNPIKNSRSPLTNV
jgi:hypothetical protein